jgi:hypothetical protein
MRCENTTNSVSPHLTRLIVVIAVIIVFFWERDFSMNRFIVRNIFHRMFCYYFVHKIWSRMSSPCLKSMLQVTAVPLLGWSMLKARVYTSQFFCRKVPLFVWDPWFIPCKSNFESIIKTFVIAKHFLIDTLIVPSPWYFWSMQTLPVCLRFTHIKSNLCA